MINAKSKLAMATLGAAVLAMSATSAAIAKPAKSAASCVVKAAGLLLF